MLFKNEDWTKLIEIMGALSLKEDSSHFHFRPL